MPEEIRSNSEIFSEKEIFWIDAIEGQIALVKKTSFLESFQVLESYLKSAREDGLDTGAYEVSMRSLEIQCLRARLAKQIDFITQSGASDYCTYPIRNRLAELGQA